MTRRERKKRETRRRIFTAAFELFLEKGFDETTVDEIAARADVAKGTVFNYFAQKSTFLAAIMEDWLNRITEEMGPVEEWPGSTREKLERLFFFLASLSAQSPALFRRALFEHLRSIPEGECRIKATASMKEFLTLTASIIAKGQIMGDIRADLDSNHAAAVVESALFKALVTWLVEGGSLEDLHEEMSGRLNIIFEGVEPQQTQMKSRTSRYRKVSG